MLAPDPQGGAKLLDYVAGGPDDLDLATRKYHEAHALVAAYVGDSPVPDVVAAEAVLEVGSKLMARQATPNARDQYGEPGSAPMVAPRDPMVTVYPTLNRWVIGGLG